MITKKRMESSKKKGCGGEKLKQVEKTEPEDKGKKDPGGLEFRSPFYDCLQAKLNYGKPLFRRRRSGLLTRRGYATPMEPLQALSMIPQVWVKSGFLRISLLRFAMVRPQGIEPDGGCESP